jgi:hypothetical protein
MSGSNRSSSSAQGTAGGTPNTGPQGTGNFVAGKPEGNGNFVSGKPGDPAKPGASTSGAGAGASLNVFRRHGRN